MQAPFYLTKLVNCDFETAIARASDQLALQGFGILTEINMQTTLAAKLGAQFRPYKILGACNAELALAALKAEPYVAALMPCNVFVQEHASGQVEVSVMNPATLVPITGNTELQAIQDEVSARIMAVLDAL